MRPDATSPLLGLQWSWLSYALAVAMLAVAVMTFRAVARAANPVLGWCLAILGLVSAVWTATSTYSARMVPIPDPTLRRPYLKCYTGADVDWDSVCGQRYADWLTAAIAPSLVLIAALTTYVVILGIRTSRMPPRPVGGEDPTATSPRAVEKM